MDRGDEISNDRQLTQSVLIYLFTSQQDVEDGLDDAFSR